jgi:heme o synthase
MLRTKNRPLPAGKISRTQAWIIALVELMAGSLLLASEKNPPVVMLGLLAFVWYNFIYTFLKRVTPHAVIPGSVIGAIPPLAGWVAAGASLNDPKAWAMAFFFFVWQVPHFYLLVMKYGEQYEKAGLPALTGRYSDQMIRLIIFLWVLATSISSLFLIYFNLIRSGIAITLLLIAAIALIVVFIWPLLKAGSEFKPFRYFMRINYYVLLVILLLNIETLIGNQP